MDNRCIGRRCLADVLAHWLIAIANVGDAGSIRSNYCNNCGSKIRDSRDSREDDAPNKLYADVAHPINQSCRDLIQRHVVKEPGYISRYDDSYESPESEPGTKPRESIVPVPHFDRRPRPASEPNAPEKISDPRRNDRD